MFAQLSRDFNKYVKTFEDKKTHVVGISTDSHHVHKAWRDLPTTKGGVGHDLKISLLSDQSHQISKYFNVLQTNGQSQRGLFIIDSDRTLQYMIVSPDGVGRNVEEIIRVVKALHFTKENGLVCPARWQEGDPGMKKTLEDVANHISADKK